jgi:hypothetical protein
MVQLSMPVATQMLLQVAERNIGQLTDIETDAYIGLASPGKRQVSSDATNIGAGSGALLWPRHVIVTLVAGESDVSSRDRRDQLPVCSQVLNFSLVTSSPNFPTTPQ